MHIGNTCKDVRCFKGTNLRIITCLIASTFKNCLGKTLYSISTTCLDPTDANYLNSEHLSPVFPSALIYVAKLLKSLLPSVTSAEKSKSRNNSFFSSIQ